MTLHKALEPIRIAGATVPNRIVRTAHATAIGGGTMSEDLIAYHERRARGGCGLTILEILGVHHTSLAPLNMIDPTLDEGYRKLMEAVEPHGMIVFQQVWHAGHNGKTLDGGPPWGPSTVPNPLGGDVPVPMTKAMIDEIVEAFAAACARCEKAGLHGAEIHAAHGYLIQQFLSPAINRREDDYGGDFANRARFLLEVMRAVRAATSRDFAVGIRLAPDLVEGGVGVQDNIRVAKALAGEGLVDFVNVSLGSYHAFPKMIGGMHEPVGYEVPMAEPITAQIDVPTIITGRFRTLAEVDQAIRAGEADLVGMTRAHIADPDIVRKTKAGHPERVRPCIACNQGCVGGLFGDNRLGCAVNVETGTERELDEDAIGTSERPGKVVIVGGGLAGLEAARIAALRGHAVILFEASADLGGTLRLAAKLPTRHAIIDIAGWLEQEVYRLGVDVRLSSYAEVDDVLAEAPDAVIVATGSQPRMDGIQNSNPGEPITGVDAPHVLSSHDLLDLKRNWKGSSAVVLDDTGHYEGLGVAEHLVADGANVTFVTPHKQPGPLVENALMVEPALERIARGPGAFRQLTRHRLRRIERDSVEISPTYAGPAFAASAETVVLVTPNAPRRALYDALAGKVATTSIVGDANSPRTLQKAIQEGHMAARAL
ncbi:MAG: NAD(P)-binding protein [Alphaproteobacteria bacterium]|jgi:2,4-dienoyl-CoA reductase-like NADH-dependent reductase (Old Yellow Enzyme family)|nr:NAD(P)-binding protein [Alphaproteobacteria bacterium]